MKYVLALAAFAALAGHSAAASANELVIGLGRSDYSDNHAENRLFGAVEYHASPFATYRGFDFGLGGIGQWGSGGSYFLGGGLVVTRNLGERWFVEFSEMPGIYHAGDNDHDLGQDLEFRSQLALGYHLNEDWSASAAVAHISNADLGDDNPGANFGFLRLHRNLGGH